MDKSKLAGTAASAVVVVGFMFAAYNAVATDEEVAEEVQKVKQKHDADRATDAQLRKNYRIDQIESELYILDESIMFGNLTAAQLKFKEERKETLKLKKQNILEEIE